MIWIIKIVNDAKNTGELAQIIDECWKLKWMPIIENIKYHQHQSKERKWNTIVIKSKTESIVSHVMKNNVSTVMWWWWWW